MRTVAGAGYLASMNGLVAPIQTFAVGTAGTDFAISSVSPVHTFNLPDAGAAARGAVTTGTQTFAGAKTFTGLTTITSANAAGVTTASSLALNANSLTTGTGLYAASSSLTSGKLVDLQVSGTAGLTGQTALNIGVAGANATGAQTTYGLQVANIHTGTSVNYGGYFSASGGSSNYGLVVAAGNVGIGSGAAAPAYALDVAGNILNLGSDSAAATRTNATGKIGRLVIPHYTNAEETVAILWANTYGATSTNLYLGGGSGSHNPVSDIFVYTGSSGSVAGTLRGSINYLGNWSIGNLPITTPKLLTVWGGDQTIVDPTDLGSTALTDGTFTLEPGAANWGVTGGWDAAFTGNVAVFNIAGGAGSLTQAAAKMVGAVSLNANRYYKFTYTVSGSNGAGAATITTAVASASTALTVTADATVTTYFKSAAAPGTFTISATAGIFSLDDLTLYEVTGGDLSVNGLITGGGTAGIKVLGSGNVLIGTTTANTKQTLGLTIDQLSSSSEILSFKSSSDISHGMTDLWDADTYGAFAKINDTVGGLMMDGITDASGSALFLRGTIGNADPTDTTAAIVIRGQKLSGTAASTLAAAETVLQIQNYGTTLATVLGNDSSASAPPRPHPNSTSATAACASQTPT